MRLNKLGIVAGGGELPVQLYDACRAVGRPVYLLAFEDQAEPERLNGIPCDWSRLGAMERTLKLLHEAGVKDLVLAGKFKRPSLASLRPDRRVMALLPRLGGRLLSDDKLMSALIEFLEQDEGFRVVAADDVMAGLRAPGGALGAHRPTTEDEGDIALGARVAKALGAFDIGQAVVVRHGVVLGVEGAEGTDGLIARCAQWRGDSPAGVLVKMRKPQQQQRADPPVIGVQTIDGIGAAGLRGIAVEADATLILDRPAVVRAADAQGLFVLGIDAAAS
jgi:UDP-2,3-diacylglucosamine hydrolase